jgi:hypothetical protein
MFEKLELCQRVVSWLLQKNMENENKRSEQQEKQPPLNNDAAVLQKIIAELAPLSWDSRRRMTDTVCTFFNLERFQSTSDRAHSTSEPAYEGSVRQPTPLTPFLFSEKETPNVKQFMIDKAPTTDIERVACLGYYLTHHRNAPHFKTKEITDLNFLYSAISAPLRENLAA